MKIPVNEPLLGEREREYVSECLRTGWISSAGRFIDDFEGKWAERCGRKYGIAVSNGTVALQAAVASLDLRPGDEVILPTFTIISCALAVIYNSCIPVLVDSEPRTWSMDVRQIQAKLTARTRAIMAVHIYGHPVDMDPILELADRYNLLVIEDAAEAHGAEYCTRYRRLDSSWQPCGSFGAVSTFSFYANKLITTGEGGMILTDDPKVAQRAQSQRNLCFIPGHRFYHEALGHNFRMTNLQAALGLAQLERFDEIVARKRWIGTEYSRRLEDVPGIQLPVEESWGKQVYWMYGIVLDRETGYDAVEFAKKLAERGIETRPFFLGMHEQPVFREMGFFKGESYPVAEQIARQGLYLPSGLALGPEQIEYVAESVQEILG